LTPIIATAAILSPIAAAGIFLKVLRIRETCLHRSIHIRSAAHSVFTCINAVDRVPEWYERNPAWAPRKLRLLTLARWGDRIPRQAGSSRGGSDGIEIRSLEDREFHYAHHRPDLLSYRSTFRITWRDTECVLTWEVCYKFSRWIDALFDSVVTAKRTREEMGESLERIRCLAETIPVPEFRDKSVAKTARWLWSRGVSKAS